MLLFYLNVGLLATDNAMKEGYDETPAEAPRQSNMLERSRNQRKCWVLALKMWLSEIGGLHYRTEIRHSYQ